MYPFFFLSVAKIQIQPYSNDFDDNSLRLSSQYTITSYLNSDMK